MILMFMDTLHTKFCIKDLTFVVISN